MARVQRRSWLPVLGLAFALACGRDAATTDATPAELAPSPSLAPDAGNVERWPAAPICPSGAPRAEVGDGGAPWEALYQAPPGARIVQVAGTSALVRDDVTGRYAVVVRGETTTSTPLVEAWDRVTLLAGDGLLVCRARACAVIGLARQDAPLALPEDFAPTAGERGCVAGTGVVCRDASGAWNLVVPAGTFPASPERASRLADDAVLLLFGDRLRLGSPTGVRDVTFATPTPIADVAPAANWRGWAGRAADGRLVVGSGPSGQACSLLVDHVITEPVAYGHGPPVRVAGWTRGADVEMNGERLRLPASAGTPIGLGQAPCGLSSNAFVGTASGLFGPPFVCLLD